MTSVEESIRKLGPWFHQIEIRGFRTRDIAPSPGPQARDNPLARWLEIEQHLPDVNGLRVFDVGCADGFFPLNWQSGERRSRLSMPPGG